MRLLLDTHVFLWWEQAPHRLSGSVYAACCDPENTLHLSVVSLWELQIKLQLGKLQLRGSWMRMLREQQEQNGLRLLPITESDILGLTELPLHHRDPFDRMLIAQARVGRFTLVTEDPEIARYDVPLLW